MAVVLFNVVVPATVKLLLNVAAPVNVILPKTEKFVYIIDSVSLIENLFV